MENLYYAVERDYRFFFILVINSSGVLVRFSLESLFVGVDGWKKIKSKIKADYRQSVEWREGHLSLLHSMLIVDAI